jgi:hypothetical protein
MKLNAPNARQCGLFSPTPLRKNPTSCWGEGDLICRNKARCANLMHGYERSCASSAGERARERARWVDEAEKRRAGDFQNLTALVASEMGASQNGVLQSIPCSMPGLTEAGDEMICPAPIRLVRGVIYRQPRKGNEQRMLHDCTDACGVQELKYFHENAL